VTEIPDEVQRWTAKRKAAVVLSIVKGETCGGSDAQARPHRGRDRALAGTSSSPPARTPCAPPLRPLLRAGKWSASCPVTCGISDGCASSESSALIASLARGCGRTKGQPRVPPQDTDPRNGLH
jgi:hypothetical protein